MNTENPIIGSGNEPWPSTQDPGMVQDSIFFMGDFDTIDCTPTPQAFNLDMPEGWADLLEQQFAGKGYGVSGFGQQFKVGLLVQTANANRALEITADSLKKGARAIPLEQFTEIIDSYDTSGDPCQARPYVAPMIIATAREDIGRAYLKVLQAKGQMMGTNYATVIKQLEDAIKGPTQEEEAKADSIPAPAPAAAPTPTPMPVV